MSEIIHRLAAKVNATFLLLLGLVIVVTQIATWSEAGKVFPIDKIIILILGLIPVGLAIYIMRDFSSRTLLLKWIMGVLVALSCVFLLSMLYLSQAVGAYDQSFFEGTGGPVVWLPQIVCVLLFVWLMAERPKKT